MKLRMSLLAAALPLCFATGASASDLTFTLVNKTSEVLTHFYTSPVGVDEWEDDVFGADVLAPGDSIEITIADGRRACKYDMKFEFEGSSKLDTTTDTQDLCEMNEYTLTE